MFFRDRRPVPLARCDRGDGPIRGCSPVLREPVTVRSGCFTYPGVTRPVLEDLSLSIRAGEVIAIIGRTAAARQRWPRSSAGSALYHRTHPLGCTDTAELERRGRPMPFADVRATLVGSAAVLIPLLLDRPHRRPHLRNAEGSDPEAGLRGSLIAVDGLYAELFSRQVRTCDPDQGSHHPLVLPVGPVGGRRSATDSSTRAGSRQRLRPVIATRGCARLARPTGSSPDGVGTC